MSHLKFSITISTLFFSVHLISQSLTIGSWNLRDFGQSRDDQEIEMIAEVLRDFDVVAIQEVVAKHPGGVQAVGRLVDVLDRKGANWDYIYSDPTNSSSGHVSERYAFIFKTNKVKLNRNNTRLIQSLEDVVEREPYLGQFIYNGNTLNILNYHACTHKTHYPERAEIEQISKWLISKRVENVVWAGDMNLVIDDIAFTTILNYGFENELNGEKTSLKTKCKNGEFLSRAEDNVLTFLNSYKVISSSVHSFINPNKCEEVEWKRVSLSDHLPIILTIE